MSARSTLQGAETISATERPIELICKRNFETFYSCLGSHAKRYYEKLQVLEFDSTRKRMSVILRDVDKDEIILFTKGAESSIIPR